MQTRMQSTVEHHNLMKEGGGREGGKIQGTKVFIKCLFKVSQK